MQDYDLLSGELFRLTRLMERSQARVAARRSDGVERAAYLLLVNLVKNGPQRLSALADAVFSDVSTVSRQVATLVKLGLVERRTDPLDGRATVLAATKAGERTFQERRRHRNELYAEMLSGWSVDERRELQRLLHRFNDRFEEFFLGGELSAVGEGSPGSRGAAEPFNRKTEGIPK